MFVSTREAPGGGGIAILFDGKVAFWGKIILDFRGQQWTRGGLVFLQDVIKLKN